MPELAIKQTPIPGLLVISLDIRRDNRGWFKENWQRHKMVHLGLPDFVPVQNMSFNNRVGATRGIHAEPWGQARVTGNRADLWCLG
jgi:dTDP-4-dehydrorhamnose 3,5-epimerase-like enzyme